MLLLTQKPVDTGTWERSRGMEMDSVGVGMWGETKQTEKAPNHGFGFVDMKIRHIQIS